MLVSPRAEVTSLRATRLIGHSTVSRVAGLRGAVITGMCIITAKRLQSGAVITVTRAELWLI